MKNIQITQYPVEQLQPYELNPRKNDHAVEAMAIGIKEFGFNVPILARSSGEIVDGHLRYKAALTLGLIDVPVVFVDDLTENQIKAFRLSVNKLSEVAKWDYKLLEVEIQNLADAEFDLSLLGFSEVELESLTQSPATGNKEPDHIPEEIPPASKPGELWTMGDHRLYIGDATIKESYMNLLGDKQVDMVWTDPPYNVNYSSKAGKIQNDNMPADDFSAFLFSFYTNAHEALKSGGTIYVSHADGQPGHSFRKEFLRAGFYFSTCLIWRKNHSTLGRGDYHYQHEPILYGWKKDAPHCWYGGRKRKSIINFGDPLVFVQIDKNEYQIAFGNEVLVVTGENVNVKSIMPTIISIDKPQISKQHPTMKPVALVEHFLINSSRPGDTVLDCFGGSGTTLIACEVKGRKAMLIENDCKYADVILRRWHEYTGKEPKNNSGETYTERLQTNGGGGCKNELTGCWRLFRRTIRLSLLCLTTLLFQLQKRARINPAEYLLKNGAVQRAS